ncbi:MAG: hypothetical protein HY506_00625 [Candidatus Yanofskybacteria bacterium]|nr:hypothetical protein [Candidatus Yanofskybacteria bacterium]
MITSSLIILIITLAFVFLNKFFGKQICPICAGVSGTWLILTAGIVFGYISADYKLPIAMLMGGTVVGVAFQGEKKISWAKTNILSWKAPVIIIGMPVAYLLFVKMSTFTIAIEAVVLVAITYLFFFRSVSERGYQDSEKIKEIEKKMEDCC